MPQEDHQGQDLINMDNHRKVAPHSRECIETTSLDHWTTRLLFSLANVPHGRLCVSSFAPLSSDGPFVASSWAVDVVIGRGVASTERETLNAHDASSTFQVPSR